MNDFVFHPAQQHVIREMKKYENQYGLVMVGRGWGKTELSNRYPLENVQIISPYKYDVNFTRLRKVNIRIEIDLLLLRGGRSDLWIVDGFEFYGYTLLCDLFHTLRERRGKILFLGTPHTIQDAVRIWSWPIWNFKYSFGTQDNWNSYMGRVMQDMWKMIPDNEYRMMIEGKWELPIDNL